MIDGYKNVSTVYYFVGLKPLDAAILATASFFFLVLWWPIAAVVLIAGYKFAKKHRARHYGYLDVFVYLTTPERYSVVREQKPW